MKLSNISTVQVSTWMGDHPVGCASVVKRPYSAMSLTLKLMSYAMT